MALWGESACAEVEQELAQVETLADEGGALASLDDRAWEQAWEPLIAVASLAGGHWLPQAITAAVALSGNRDDELDEGVNLLSDIRTVFEGEPERESLATYELLDALLALDESPWREWWSDPRADEVKPSKGAPRKLAHALKPFGVHRADVWTPSGQSRKGYRLHDFRDPWSRYLPSPGERDGRGEREPSVDAGFQLAHGNVERAREDADERGGRGDLAPTGSSRPSRPPRPPREPDEWDALIERESEP